MSMEKYYTISTTTIALARWLQMDSLAEKYPGWSPYNYSVNNPVIVVDSDGRSAEQSDGPYDEDKKKNKRKIYTSLLCKQD